MKQRQANLSLSRRRCSVVSSLFVFALIMVGCSADTPTESVEPTQEPVSLVFDEEMVPGPATSTLLAEAEKQPVYNHFVPAVPAVEVQEIKVVEKKPVLQPVKIESAKSEYPESEALKTKTGGWWDRSTAKQTSTPNTTKAHLKPLKATKKKRVAEKKYVPGKLEVLSAVTCSNVSNRRPVNAKSTFTTKDDKVWVWLQLKNGGPATQVDLVWKKDGVKIWTVDLNVGHGRRWRTWARKSIRRVNVGSWTVEVQDREGNLLKTVAFNVQPTAAAEVSSAH